MNMFNSPLAQALGWTLLHSLWQGALVGALFALGRSILGARAVRARYALGCFALVLVVLLSGFTYAREAARMKVPSMASSPASAGEVIKWQDQSAKNIAQDDSPKTFAWLRSMDVQKAFPAMIVLWLAGVALMTLRGLGGFCVVQRLRRSARDWKDAFWQAKLKQFADELGIAKAVKLCQSTLVQTPSVVGYFKPLLILPAAVLAKLSPEQLEAVLWHELTHIKRNDYIANLLQIACETLFFYHPAVWWISRNIREEREHCCDDVVIGKGADSAKYARALCLLEEFRIESAPLFQIAGTGGSLKTRIQRLLAPPRLHSRSPVAGIALLIALATALFFAAAWPNATAQVAPHEDMLQFRLVRPENDSRPADQMSFAASARKPNEHLYVLRGVLLDGSHITEAKVVKDPLTANPEISIKLDDEGKRAFAKLTRENINRQLAVVFQGKILMAPVIRSEIPGGQISISGNFTEQEANELAKQLQPPRRTGEVSRQEKPITFQAWFIQTTGAADTLFGLQDKVSIADLDLLTFNAEQKDRILNAAAKSDRARIIHAPLVTTVSGKSVRLQMGKISDIKPSIERKTGDTRSNPIFSVNATGYVITHDSKNPAKDQTFDGPAAALLGPSLEIMPELLDDKISLNCPFQVSDRDAVMRNNGHFRADLSSGRVVVVQQKQQAGDSNEYLFLMISPKFSD
jgi:beta-lactamase regulating signal transducer with metallopeptidase domain